MAAPFAQVKLCPACCKLKPRDEFHKASNRRSGCQTECKVCTKVRTKRTYDANPQAAHRKNVEQYAKHRDKRREGVRQYGADLKALVFAHYGTSCACCASTRDLTIDHIGGDGRAWREATFGHNKAGGTAVYRWIIANGFPGGLQTLCRRCNVSKADGQHCRLKHIAQAVSHYSGTLGASC
jgi:hypothetical protein